MDYQRIADLIYPDLQHDTDYYEKLFPARDLPEGAEVMRMAPSPTGFIHLGKRGAVVAIDADKAKALLVMKERLQIVLAKGYCKNISRQEVHALVDDIFDEYGRG